MSNSKMRVQVTYEQAVLALKHAVAKMGEDFTYTEDEYVDSCVYFDADRQPSCIVGHVLDELGLAPLPLHASANACGVPTLVRRGVLAVDRPQTEDLLASAQFGNDKGEPWGQALATAIDYANREGASS